MENYKLELIQEFENIDRMPIFEINIADHLSPDLGIEEEYYIFNIGINDEGIYAGFGTNCGIKKVKDLFIEWDEYCSLDEHLSYLYELCSEWAVEDFEKSLEGL